MRLLTTTIMFCAAAGTVLAQQSTARLLGTVTDQTGAVVVDALVKAVNTATGQTREARTSGTGEYSISPLPIGDYQVTAEAAGFKISTFRGLVLQVNQEARLDLSLTIGSASETVSVEALAPLLVTDSSSVGQVIENKAIVSMPLNGRAFWQLAQLTPGVVFTPGGSDITAGGQGIRATRIGLRISGSSRLAGA